ncbi:MAG: hypothetical protein M1485_06315 [Chloroflexi bacterium]|nr:hypothetical protein [Chloroflexota bacterium]
MKSKLIFCLSFIIIFAQACSSSVSIPTTALATPTLVTPTAPAPAVTEAPATPTAIPTPESSPTPAGPKEGDTKAENGYTYTYTVVRTADGKAEYSGWFRPMTPTAINMMDWVWYLPDGAKGIAPITIFVEDNVPGADAIQVFTHSEIAKGQGGSNSYINALVTAFGNNNNDKWLTVRDGMEAGTQKYPVQFGNTSFDFYPSPKHGSIVYVFNPNNPVISKENGSVEWDDGQINHDHKFKTIFWGLDAQGNTLGGIASETPLNQLNPEELPIFPFYHVASIIGGTGGDLKLYSGGYSQLLQRMREGSQKSDPPYVEISTQTPSPTSTP